MATRSKITATESLSKRKQHKEERMTDHTPEIDLTQEIDHIQETDLTITQSGNNQLITTSHHHTAHTSSHKRRPQTRFSDHRTREDTTTLVTMTEQFGFM